MAELMKSNARTGFEIAVIGMAGRFPGARNVGEFWENLKNGVESITFLSDEELLAAGVTPNLIENPDYVKIKGGVLEDVEYFDASFFGYIPAEAEIMDPQTRLFHECAWEALEDAGYDPDSNKGMIGVYAGASSNINWELLSISAGKIEQAGDLEALNLIDKDHLCTRISYKLHLNGPAVMLLSACSTSLVAIHMACRALLNGECHMALAGGVSLITHYVNGYLYQEGMIYSPDGHCRAFDAEAKGIVGGSGVGIVVLKLLEDALADRDHIYAVVKGTAINNDGVRRIGYTAPSIEGQAEVIRAALHMAEVEPESITYIETHGTGTVLGDPIEIEALTQAFNTDKKGFCSVGSVKTNIGHLDSAAGVTGFIKTVLALKNRLIPPSLNYETPNPKIDFDNSPFYVNTTLREWKNAGGPLRAGVSSFGIGGTNAHVVLEAWSMEHEAWGGEAKSREYQLILLSAKTPAALDKMTANLANYLKKYPVHPVNPVKPVLTLADAAYTLQVGRQVFPYRRMLVCSTGDDAAAALSSNDPAKLQSFYSKKEERNVVFMFSGQGSQYVDMGLELYRTEPVFREEMDRCFALLEPLMGSDIKAILYPGEIAGGDQEKARKEAEEKIKGVVYTGPVKFIFEYSLAKLIMKWGIQPHAMIGHSIGEYPAACLAGVFSLEQALELVVLRAKMMGKTPPGAMMSVPLPEEELKPLLKSNNELSLAAVNTASLCLVSGPPGAVDAFEKKLNRDGIECLRLNVRCAFHSNLMEPVLTEFENSAAKLTYNKPRLPYISGLTGKWAADGEIIPDHKYWTRHIRETVRFKDGLDLMVKELNPVFIQVGSDRGLPLFVERHPGTGVENLTVNLVRHPKEKENDVRFLLNKIGQLWLWGIKIDWPAFYAPGKRHRVPLPPYPFERQRFWVDGGTLEIDTERKTGRGTAVKKRNMTDWFYIPSWKRTGLPFYKNDAQVCSNHLVFIDDCDVGSTLVKRLEENNGKVITVKPGLEFSKQHPQAYQVNPGEKRDYETLFEELQQLNKMPDTIIHLWNLTKPTYDNDASEITRFKRVLGHGFYSLLNVAQAIGKLGFAGKIQIVAVSNNMQDVTGEETLYPEKATVLGPVKVIPQEYPNISCKNIDIALPEPGKKKDHKLINRLLAEIGENSSDKIIAYRGGHRWVQVFEPVQLEKPGERPSLLKEKGVYLVTGGLGNIGLLLAEYLAKSVKGRLILTGRSPFPAREDWDKWLDSKGETDSTSRKILKIRELEAAGAEVAVFSADTADKKQMQKVIARAEERFGKLDGVIHSTASRDDFKTIDNSSNDTCEAQFQSKIYGVSALEEILRNKAVDFCILMSSLSSLLGGIGHAAYSSANLFMDSFVHRCSRAGRTYWITLNWDFWKFGEIVERGALGANSLELAITPEEGMKAFPYIFSLSEVNQLIISTGDFQIRLDKWIKLESLEEKSTPGKKGASLLHPRPDLETSYAAPRTELEKSLAGIWEKFFGFEKIGIHDDFFQLGGDSLKAMTAAANIHKELNVKIPIAEFFKRPTVSGIAGFLKEAVQTVHSAIEPMEEKEYYPMSSAQKRLYTLHHMEIDSTYYNCPMVVLLEGKLEREKMETVLRKLIERHESFRTSFEMIGNEPFQKIHEKVDFRVDYYDKVSELEEEKIIKNSIKPFDLSRPPLLRVGFLEKSSDKYIFMIDMHHIITDGASVFVFEKELMALYAGEELPSLKLQYKDFSEWQHKLMKSGALKQQENYWLKQLEGEIPILNLPTDFPISPVQNFDGDMIPFEIGGDLYEKIKRLAAKTEVTLYIVLLSVYTLLLSKLSEQEDIVVGTTIAGRTHPDLQNIVGFFINMLVMRNQPKADKTYNEFLMEVKENALKAYENQDYPFEVLVEKLHFKREPGRHALIDAVILLHNQSEPLSEFGIYIEDKNGNEESKLEIREYESELKKAPFTLCIDGVETEKKILMRLVYATSLFKHSTAVKLTKLYIEILEQAAVDRETPLLLRDIEISGDFLAADSKIPMNMEFGF